MLPRLIPAFLFAGFLSLTPCVSAQRLQTFKDCAVGKRVSTNDGRKGVITKLDPAWSYCYVRFDDNGKEQSILYSLLNAEPASGKPQVAQPVGGQLQSFRECTVGRRVSTNDGKKGVITRLDPAWSYCYVRFDGAAQEQGFLYSLLNAEGASAPSAGGPALRPGTYECVSQGGSSLMNLQIAAANSYSSPDGSGKFRIESTGRIVFETGPMQAFHSMLLSGARIGLNNDGGTFYSIACEFRKP
jgi:hypothetical protein